MNNLKCKYHGSTWNDANVVSLPVKDLWASVPKADRHKGKAFYTPVMKDIKENGLCFPLLVVEATHKQLMAEKKRYKDAILDLPFDENDTDLEEKIYVVWGGSNRVRIAEELGYDHVDCVILINGQFDKARGMQRLHRKPYQKKFY